VLALTFVELLARLVADLLGQAQYREARVERRQHAVESRREIEAFEDGLLFLVLDLEEARDHVGQRAGRSHALHHAQQFIRRVGQQRDGFARRLFELHQARFDLGAAVLGIIDIADARHHERPTFQEFQYAEAPLTLYHQVMGAAGRGDIAQDAAVGAHPVQIVGPHFAHVRVALEQQANLLRVVYRRLGGRHRLRAADGDGRGHTGKQHQVAHWQQDQGVVRQRLDRRVVGNGSAVRNESRGFVLGQGVLRNRPVLSHGDLPVGAFGDAAAPCLARRARSPSGED
jgi:hypothetical protein